MSDTAPAPGSTLDTSKFNTVFSDNFVADTYFDWNKWPAFWGHWSSLNFQPGYGVDLTGYQWDNWSPAGFMEGSTGPTSGHGYGLYQVNATLQYGQVAGAAALLWPASNVWPGPEIDLLESYDWTRQSGIQTVHWVDANGQPQFQPYIFNNVDTTQPHTYSVVWQATRLDFYIDNRLVQSVTDHVPLDAADGGSNMLLGAEVTQTPQTAADHVSIHINSMSYSAFATAPTAGSSSPSPAPAPDPTPSPSPSPSPAPDPTPIPPSPTPSMDFVANGNTTLTGSSGSDVWFVDTTGTPNDTTILNFSGGDVVGLVGLDWNIGNAKWIDGTDPSGRSGATLAIDTTGSGHIDSEVTLAGVSLSQAETFAMSSGSLDGRPLLAISG